MDAPRQCPRCGQLLAPDAPQGLCPACLLQAGIPTNPPTAALGATSARPPFVPPAPAQLAPLFPQLEILELIGQGGMGAVYKARQPSLDRMVALKILPPQPVDDPGFTERFAREARALARLNHPNIVAIYDFGKAGEFHYLLMEYLDGLNLRLIERSGRLAPREALEIIPQICAALQFAHDEGIVHRDIKPENILLDKKGRVKIADFGLAKIFTSGGETPAPAITQAGHVMGTPHYMAPEQVERPLEVDHRADIFSLGVVFYEMLTGELPLGRFPAPSRKAGVDARLDNVVLRALEKEPGQRYQQAGQVKTDVETIARGGPPPPAQTGRPAALPPWWKRAVAWSFVAGFLAMLAPFFVHHFFRPVLWEATATMQMEMANGASANADADAGQALAQMAESHDVRHRVYDAMTPVEREQFTGLANADEAQFDKILQDRSTVNFDEARHQLSFSVLSYDTDVAIRMANLFAQTCDEYDTERRSRSIAAAAELAAEQTSKAQAQLEEVRQKMDALTTQYGREYFINNGSLLNDQLLEKSKALGEAETRLQAAEAPWRQLQQALADNKLLWEVPVIAEDVQVAAALDNLYLVRGKLAILQQTYGPNHPEVKAVMAEMDQVLGARDAAVKAAVDRISADHQVAQDAYDQAKAAVAKLNPLASAQEQYSDMMKQKEQIEETLQQLQKEQEQQQANIRNAPPTLLPLDDGRNTLRTVGLVRIQDILLRGIIYGLGTGLAAAMAMLAGLFLWRQLKPPTA